MINRQGAAPAPVHPVLNHLGRNRLGDVVDLPGGMHLGIPRIKPPAAAGADLGTVMLDPVRRPRTSERRAGMALLAARAAIGPAAGIVAGRGVRLRQAVARRRLAAVGAVKAKAALKLADPLKERRVVGIAVRQRHLEIGDDRVSLGKSRRQFGDTHRQGTGIHKIRFGHCACS